MTKTHFQLDERLAILKAADSARKWHSLDDKRVCVICDRVFTGRQIDIQSDQKGHYFLACPTPTCTSNISHWFLCEVSHSLSEPSNEEQREFSMLGAIRIESEKLAVSDG
jgi:hypothetical protein